MSPGGQDHVLSDLVKCYEGWTPNISTNDEIYTDMNFSDPAVAKKIYLWPGAVEVSILLY